MITETQALEIAKRFIESTCEVDGGVAIIEDQTVRKPYGWIFVYNSRRFLETHSPLDALGGNGPVVVERATGRVHQLSSAFVPAVAIAAFERAHGLA